MSTPTYDGRVDTDHLVQGAQKYLASCSEILDLLGAFPNGTPWLFQHQLWVDVEGSGSTAIVLRRQGGWAAANLFNSLRFPRLGVEIWADPKRDTTGNVTEPGEVYRRIEAVFTTVDARLHRPQGDTQMWGDIRTLASVRLAEPAEPLQINDSDGLLRMTAFYAITHG